MKQQPLNLDLTRWPVVSIRGVEDKLPLPRGGMGRNNAHVCQLGCVYECLRCELRRDAQDRVLRARMMSAQEQGRAHKPRVKPECLMGVGDE